MQAAVLQGGLLRRRALLAALLGSAAALAQPVAPVGAPPELADALPGARLLGSGTLRFLGLHVYDARLWSGRGAPLDDWIAAPFALEIVYARAFGATQLAERSLAEMRLQRDIDATTAERWLGTMAQLFPDVRPGDRITAVNLPSAAAAPAGGGARFFVNGQLRGESREVEFVRLFFGIWLSPRTSEPALRAALLGRPR